MSDAEGLPDGAYHALVTQALSALLASGDAGQRALVSELRDADAPDRLARHISVLVGAAIGAMRDGDRAVDGAALIGRLIDVLAEFSPSDVAGEQLAPPPRVLEGVRTRRPDGELAALELPLTPLLDTTVLTNRAASRRSSTSSLPRFRRRSASTW